MRRKTVYSAIEGIDRSQLEAFQAGTEPKQFCTVDHSKPLEPQISQNPAAAGAASSVAVGGSTAPALGEGELLRFR